MTDLTPPPAELLVCIKCLRGGEAPETGTRPGEALFARLAPLMPKGVTLRATECLSNCTRGCSIALRGPGRWTFVYGDLDETTDAEVVAEGARLYRAAPDGLVPWRSRPEHFKRHCIARIPPLED
ncbi:MAG: DUF1636 domain-containing protein [Pseudomonadota bacterium]